MKKVVSLFLALCLLLCVGSCFSEKSPLSTPPLAIRPHDESGFYLLIPADELCGMGFALGDSVDVELSNGVVLEDLPLYNGYYVKTDTIGDFMIDFPLHKCEQMCYNHAVKRKCGGIYGR